MSAFKIFSRFADLLDIKITRAAAAWLRLNEDGTVSERTSEQTLSDLGGISGIDNSAVNTAISTNTSATLNALGLAPASSPTFAGLTLSGNTLTIGSGTYPKNIIASQYRLQLHSLIIDNNWISIGGAGTLYLGPALDTPVSRLAAGVAGVQSLVASGTVVAGNFKRGTGSPESVVTGSVGDIYTRTDGGAGTTLYVKESGTATNTGWIAK